MRFRNNVTTRSFFQKWKTLEIASSRKTAYNIDSQ